MTARSGFLSAVATVPWMAVAFGLAPGELSGQTPDLRDPAAPGVLLGTVSAAPPGGDSILSPGPGKPLGSAWVMVSGTGRPASDLTDPDGSYRIAAVEPGVRQVRVERLGYRDLEVEVRIPPGDTVHLDLRLRWEAIPVAGFEIRATPVSSSIPLAPPDLAEAAQMDLRSLTAGPGFVEAGIADVAREVVGGDGGDPSRTLLMRGSTADQRMVLLDGAPVYTPFHLGGLLRSFDPSLLASTVHFVGGAPARYGGGLSHLLDVRTRAGRRDGLHASAFLDLLSGGLTLEGPIADLGSVLVSGRGIHEGGYALDRTDEAPFGYGEILARADFGTPGDHHLSLTGFWNQEEVRLDLTPRPEVSDARTLATATLVHPSAASWGNGVLSGRYMGHWGSADVALTLAGSRYRATLPLGGESPAVGDARTDQIRAVAEVGVGAGEWDLGLGLSAERIDHRSHAMALVADSIREVSARDRGRTLAAYVEGSRDLGDEVEFRGGIRVDHFPDVGAGDGGIRVAPRATLAWHMREDATLTIAAGRFYQLPRGSEVEVGVTLEDPGGLETGRAVYPPAQATHLVVSLDQELSPDLDLGIDGFVKGFRNLPGSGSSVLRSSGIELHVLRSGERLSGWIGYSLAWFWTPREYMEPTGRTVPTIDPTASQTGFTGRHLLTVGLDGTLFSSLGGTIRVSYGDGLPFTSVPLQGPESAGFSTVQATADQAPEQAADAGPAEVAARRVPTLDGFLRLDLELYAEWEASWLGRSTHIRPYVKLMNAVSRRDALFYYFEPWHSDNLRRVGERPVLPVAGVSVRF